MNPAAAAAVADPTKNYEAREAGLLFSHRSVAVFRKFRYVLSWHPRLLRFRIREVSSFPTELISNPVSKFLFEKKLQILKLNRFRL